MKITIALFVAAILAGCNAVTVANVACIGAEAGASVAVTVTSDAAGANDARTAAKVAKVIQGACPGIVAGVTAVAAAAKK